ncbi:sulfite exporter TauE/SafE family protein [Sinisalibacter aestuarii]|uniref:Probable membrane transporter protein n=1 Tax=Sinisalibacter aestuarii TaxID=2949426 RepID=A0ABQ5LPY5_9RHOB|nr:sulfite exporter TauE/SafE family protein [Sinisalibacter aestuarii]GKY87065.1 UPF0721 transmembrane protein [Sinisalibacter aestuarii]
MPTDLTFYAVVAIAVTILGLSKGGFPGIGMASAPLVATVVGPMAAVSLVLPIMLVQDVIVVLIYRRSFHTGVLLRMVPGGLIGIAFAYYFAASVPEWAVLLALGVVSVAFSIWALVGLLAAIPQLEPAVVRRWDGTLATLAGWSCGFTSAIAHVGYPPYQIYVMPKNLSNAMYVGTSAIFFAALDLAKVPSYAALGLFSLEQLKISAMFIPLAILSSWIGAVLVRYLDTRRFQVIITAILLVIGLVLIGQALLGMS